VLMPLMPPLTEICPDGNKRPQSESNLQLVRSLLLPMVQVKKARGRCLF
jgi:hypothetical protein